MIETIVLGGVALVVIVPVAIAAPGVIRQHLQWKRTQRVLATIEGIISAFGSLEKSVGSAADSFRSFGAVVGAIAMRRARRDLIEERHVALNEIDRGVE